METWVLWVDNRAGDVYYMRAGLLGAIKIALEDGAKKLVVKVKKQKRT